MLVFTFNSNWSFQFQVSVTLQVQSHELMHDLLLSTAFKYSVDELVQGLWSRKRLRQEVGKSFSPPPAATGRLPSGSAGLGIEPLSAPRVCVEASLEGGGYGGQVCVKARMHDRYYMMTCFSLPDLHVDNV